MSDDQEPAGLDIALAQEVAELRLVGWSHRTSSLHVLEQVAVPRSARPGLLHRLQEAGHSEVVVLSTCSRTEIYTRGPGAPVQDPLPPVDGSPRATGQVPPADLVLSGPDVVSHLFRVTGGLDSRMVGEVEIREQVRGALRDATAAGSAGPTLTRLFAAALRSGARVQQQTQLGAHGRSLSHRAVDLGLEGLDGSRAPFVLVVGAGRMARTAVEHLARRGVRAHVAARDRAMAARLVGVRRVCPIGALHVGIQHADLVICATSASSFVVTAPHVRRAMRSRSTPLTVVDLSVPRNVDTAITSVGGVRLVDLSHMHDEIASDPVRQSVVQAAHDLVQREELRYLADASARAAAPLISQMRRQVEQLCLAELVRKRRLALDEDEATALARSLTGKLLHGPVLAVREAARHGDEGLLQHLSSLFAVPSAPSVVPQPPPVRAGAEN